MSITNHDFRKIKIRSTLHEDEVFDSNLWSIRPFFLILQLAHNSLSFICLEGTKDATYNLTALFFISLTSVALQNNTYCICTGELHWSPKKKKTNNNNCLEFQCDTISALICRQTAMCCPAQVYLNSDIFKKGTEHFSRQRKLLV